MCVEAIHARRMGGRWEVSLDHVPGAKMSVDFKTTKGEVVRYSVALVLETRFGVETVRVYDAAHGVNEMHRYTRREGKQDGVVFNDGTLAEGLQAAIEAVKHCHFEIIEGWKGRHGGDEEL